MVAISNVTIRPMSMDDLNRVTEIDKLSFPLPWPESSYRFELTANRASILLVAEVAGRLVGYVGCWLLVDEVHISTLAVHPEFRQQGIARRLLNDLLHQAASGGAELATLEVRISNQAAIDLYESFGFQISGRRPRYYRDNQEDAHIMTLYELPGSPSRMEVRHGG
jgi:ribosomal-protein-alanine N-acetyltransferase